MFVFKIRVIWSILKFNIFFCIFYKIVGGGGLGFCRGGGLMFNFWWGFVGGFLMWFFFLVMYFKSFNDGLINILFFLINIFWFNLN